MVPESFLQHLAERLKGFTDLEPQVQRDLAYLVWNYGSWQREHEGLPGYMTISYKELQRRFRRGGFERANSAVPVFEVDESPLEEARLTKGYRLTPEVYAIRADYLHNSFTGPTRLICTDGKRISTVPAAIAAKDRSGRTQTAWRGAKVHNTVPVDLSRLRALYERLLREQQQFEVVAATGDVSVTGALDAMRYEVDALAKLLRLADNEATAPGHVMTRYEMKKSGRLYAEGTSLQTMPRRVRSAALHGMWDYDIENCHYAIIRQMAAEFGYEAEAIAAYLANKNAVRQGIADRVKISVEQVKTCLLAVVYGAYRSTREGHAIPSEIGQEAAARLYVDPMFARLHMDIKESGRAVLSGYPKRGGQLINAMRLGFPLSEPAPKRLAHLTHGVEAKALRGMQALFPDEIVLLMHDGFVSHSQLDKARLSGAIHAATGYTFELSEERIDANADVSFPFRYSDVSH
jgi:hypothetical protein